ncbi:MAG: diguanylate cyclase, partial [Actinomycetes bacterium]
VTELVSGVDIVREQLRIAAGAQLSADVLAAGERAATPSSHAIEVRIAAEVVKSVRVPVTVSIGLAQPEPDTPESADSLLHRADEALYRAKRAGRNRAAQG